MSIYVLLALAVILILTWVYFQRDRKGDVHKPIPGPKGVPFLGPVSLLKLSKPYNTFYDFAIKYGRIFQLSLFGNNIVFVNDPEMSRHALCDDAHGSVFLNRPKTFVGKYILVDGEDLALAETYGKQTVLFRKMLNQCLKKISEETRSFDTKTANELNNLLEAIDSYHENDLDMTTLLRTFIGNVMFVLLYGDSPYEKEADMIWEFSDNVLSLMETSMNLFLVTFPVARLLPGLSGDLYRRTSKARDQIFERFSTTSNDEKGLYKTLTEFQKETNLKYGDDVISDGNVKSILLDVISAATLGSVTFIAGGILVLLNNRECMRAVQDEIEKIIGQERKPELADKSEMHYTMACLHELLRYITIGTLGLPHRLSEHTVLEGYHLSKDTLLYTNIWFIHHDPALWTDPWKFDPQRFLDDTGKLQPPSAACRRNLMPFSVGKRSCPGGDFGIGRAFLYLTTILQTFDLDAPNDGGLLDPDPRSYTPGAFLSVPEYRCRAVRRKKTAIHV